MSASVRPAAVVFARMSSSRLPGKALTDIGGHLLIDHVVERARRSPAVSSVVVATSSEASDDPLVAHLDRRGVPTYRGDLDHVASRAVGAARELGAELFFRVNGDSPFAAVELFPSAVALADGADLVSNVEPRRLPPGATVELIRTEALAGCLDDMTSEDAEHVTAHLYRHREQFAVQGLPCPDLGFRPDDRLVVDDEEDLARARRLVSAMSGPSWEHGLADVAALLRAEDGTA